MKVVPLLPIALVLSLSGISAALLYILLKNNEDETDMIDKEKFVKYVTLEVKIAKESVGVVIGRGGSNIKQIQEETGTKITMREEKEEDIYNRICQIRGTPEAAEKASLMIRNIVLNQPLITTREIFVPESACGRIIGKNGTNIRNISSASSARIQVDRYNASTELTLTNCQPERRVVIKGTEEQIELAVALVKEKVDEDREMRAKMEESLAQRSPRKPEKALFLTAGPENSREKKYLSERLGPAGGDGYVQIFVSALEDPDHFWVQLVGQRATELDHLVEEMTEYYSKEENREVHALRETNAGQLVAAPFSSDNKWYRAQVKRVTADDYDIRESDVSLFYVDYGDSADVKQKQVFDLRTDFLRLRFQAIECCLADVKPKGDSWTEESSEAMEELCRVALWEVLMARVVGCRERPRSREGSPVPLVSLVNTNGPKDVSVAEELVKRELAVWDKPATAATENGNASRGSTSENGSLTSIVSAEDRSRREVPQLLPDTDTDDESDMEMG